MSVFPFLVTMNTCRQLSKAICLSPSCPLGVIYIWCVIYILHELIRGLVSDGVYGGPPLATTGPPATLQPTIEHRKPHTGPQEPHRNTGTHQEKVVCRNNTIKLT